MRALTLATREWSSTVSQDILCILSLWFQYGKHTEVYLSIEAGLNSVHLDNWLGVLPQLIARIDHPNNEVKVLLHHLLGRLGKKHSQALVYPLSVAVKSPRGGRKEAAESLMANLRSENPTLIEQALLVSEELVRVAVLWEESWHFALESASHQLFGECDFPGMLDTIQPHQAKFEAVLKLFL
jgi:FKBP12-rapamycin complex-associated protein